MYLHTHIMFQNGQASSAAQCYAALPGAELLSEDDAGGAYLGRVRVGGQELILFESPVQHAFDMTPAVSMFLVVDAAEQVEATIAHLVGDAGSIMMPVGEYDFATCFGWCIDRFGVSWQVSTQ